MVAAESALRRRGEDGLARAVAMSYRGRLPAAEAEWAERIERVRVDLEACNDALDRDGRTVADVTRSGSKRRREASMLMALVRTERPASVIEMGTCVGISGAYLAAALRLNGNGVLVTLERGAERVGLARQVWADLGLADLVDARVGRFANTLAPALSDQEPVDFLFVDGHHERVPTLEFYAAAGPHLRAGALVVFDDIRWSGGMREAWADIERQPDQQFAVKVGDIGIVRRA
jgi:predicted O-methyltransferase YrrM